MIFSKKQKKFFTVLTAIATIALLLTTFIPVLAGLFGQ